MDRLQLLLGKLAEEGGEVAQIALKTQQFGLHEVCPDLQDTNAQRTHKELDDIWAAVEMLNEELDFGSDFEFFMADKEAEYKMCGLDEKDAKEKAMSDWHLYMTPNV